MERYRPKLGRGVAAAVVSVFLVAGGDFAANAVFAPARDSGPGAALATDDPTFGLAATDDADGTPEAMETREPRETPEADETPEARETREPRETPQAKLAPATTASQAIDFALAAVPGGAIVEVGLDEENGRTLWEIVVRRPDGSGVELYIDAATGRIVDQDPHQVPTEARTSAPSITALRAISIALGAAPGGTVLEVDLDTEHGRTVWEVLVRRPNVEIYIDAVTGEMIKVEPTDDESDDDESDDD